MRTLRALLPACTTIAGCVASGVIGEILSHMLG